VAPPLNAAETSGPPNILFVLADDLRLDAIHALGNAGIQTPNLDTLARDGTVFTRATCAYPICVVSRAEILTGVPAFRTGVQYEGARIHTNLALWPETMRRGGYHTWFVGKWHNDGQPKQRGYEETRGLYAGGGAPKPLPPYRDWKGRDATGYTGWTFKTDDGRAEPEKGVGLTPDISARFADVAVELIQRKPDKPFFLHISFTAPHDPRLMPTGYAGRYKPANIPLPKNFLPEHPFDHGNFKGRDEVLLPWPRTPEAIREELAVYYAVVSHLDAQIGRILAALRDSGQATNTVVIFTSDHGLALGSHGLFGKQNMYEHTIGVPLIVAGPGIPKGRRTDAQCYLRDLFPTTCELARIPIPATVQGRSLVPVLRGAKESVYPFVIGYFTDTQRMIRTEEWKLIHYPEAGRRQLFDLTSDPDELKDVASDSKHATTLADLQSRLTAWLKENGDPLADK
jgi:arylsulfatase A-like enzyme